MKICYLLRTKDVYMPRWYEFFLKRGHEVHIIAGDESNIDIEVNIVDGVNIHYVSEKKLSNQNLSFVYNLLRLPLIIKELKRIIKQISPDIIHAHHVTPFGLWATLSNVHPYLVTAYGSSVLILARRILLYKLITKYVLKKADIITCDSRLLQEAIVGLGARSDKIHIIQNGVNLEVFKPEIEKNKIRSKFELGDSPLIFSNRGTTPLYNLDCVVKAIPKVLKVFPNVKFAFCNSSSHTFNPELKELARNLGVIHSTMFIGHVEFSDIPFYQKDADINVSVPSSDSSPASVYEAMACGTPVIISELPWTKHFMKNGENALIVPPKNPEAIADSIIEILQNDDLKNRLIKCGLSTVRQYVNYQKNMEIMENLMTGLVEKR